jgi:uncharacterized protein YydD (DUF2326 family)
MDWTTWLQFTATGLGVVVAFAGLFAGVGYFKKGKADGKLDTITLFKEQVDALTNKVGLQEVEIEKLRKEVHELNVSINEKDKKLTETLAILQGRDPQMQTLMEIMKKYMETNIPLLEEIKTEAIPTIKKLDKFLNKQQF